MRIPLTAGQAVTIHGWLNPKEWLTWADVAGNEKLTLVFLPKHARRPKELLHRLQPDVTAWRALGKVGVEDLALLSPWGVHPIRDLKANLGDLIHMRWSAQALAKTGMTYADLVEAGMTPLNMGMFGYTLYDWGQLGMTHEDADKIPAHELGRLFNLTRADVAKCLKK